MILYVIIGLLVTFSKPMPTVMGINEDSIECTFRGGLRKSFPKNQLDEILLRSTGPRTPFLAVIFFKSNKETLFKLWLNKSYNPSKSEVLKVIEALHGKGYKISNWP